VFPTGDLSSWQEQDEKREKQRGAFTASSRCCGLEGVPQEDSLRTTTVRDSKCAARGAKKSR
jgi:hypothetical protein